MYGPMHNLVGFFVLLALLGGAVVFLVSVLVRMEGKVSGLPKVLLLLGLFLLGISLLPF